MRRRGFGSSLVLFGAALAALFGQDAVARTIGAWRHAAEIQAAASGLPAQLPPWMFTFEWRVLSSFLFSTELPLVFLAGGIATFLGVVGRWLAFARVRQGRADPLERLRAPGWRRRALTAAPWALATVMALARFERDPAVHVATGLLAALVVATTSIGVRALLASLDDESNAPKNAREIVFSAVPVTLRTRAAVAGFAVATVAMIAAMIALSSVSNWAWVPYVAIALAVPFAFGRLSRIAVGIDGIWVRDASRARFFAYGAIDEARASGGGLELVTRGRTVLRLQMHGQDAARRDEVIVRVNDAIARSREETNRAAEMVVQAMPTRSVAATTMGAEQYRLPSITREQLWELVEGPTTAASARAAAAEALAHRLDAADRVRLRVVATQCAEPRMRLALDALAGESEDAEDVGEGRSPRPTAAAPCTRASSRS